MVDGSWWIEPGKHNAKRKKKRVVAYKLQWKMTMLLQSLNKKEQKRKIQ